MTNDPTINTAIGAAIEKCLNFALKYDPASRNQLSALENYILCVHAQSPELKLYFTATHNKIDVRSHSDSEPDVSVSGKAIDFILAMAGPKHSLADSHISVSGKIHLLNLIKALLADLDIDWEQALTEIVGVVPGHAAAEATRTSMRWIKQQTSYALTSLPDYLAEELRAIPSKTELENFYDGVDQLKSASQRLEAKIVRLKKSLSTRP